MSRTLFQFVRSPQETLLGTVMQSFFIPALGSQIYAMGGMVTQLNLQASAPGASLGENTMYSGDGFHQQKFTAVAMSSADFETWVGKVRATGNDFDSQTQDKATLISCLTDVEQDGANPIGLGTMTISVVARGSSLELADH